MEKKVKRNEIEGKPLLTKNQPKLIHTNFKMVLFEKIIFK